MYAIWFQDFSSSADKCETVISVGFPQASENQVQALSDASRRITEDPELRHIVTQHFRLYGLAKYSKGKESITPRYVLIRVSREFGQSNQVIRIIGNCQKPSEKAG